MSKNYKFVPLSKDISIYNANATGLVSITLTYVDVFKFLTSRY